VYEIDLLPPEFAQFLVAQSAVQIDHQGGVSNNVAIGSAALSSNTSGNNNIAIGVTAGNTGGGVSNGDSNIYIGNINFSTIGPAIQGESNTIRIGFSPLQTRAFIGGINGVTTALPGTAVLVDGNGQLGTVSSSRRFKYDIQDMDAASAKLLQLRPVTFRYKHAQSDGSHPLQYGLIAEEVADVYPELVQNSREGEPNAVLYHVLPAMLLNQIQREHRKIEAQEEQIHSLQEQVAQLAAQTRQLQMEVAAFNAQREHGSELAAVKAPGPLICRTPSLKRAEGAKLAARMLLVIVKSWQNDRRRD
jgi:hypothetical protein